MNQLAETTSFAPASVGTPEVATPAAAAQPAAPAPRVRKDDSLFERLPWLYVFFRERCFRDDTDRIVRTLWGNGQPSPQTRVIELGCGPGFYSCQLAARFPQISVTGVDQSARQLDLAQKKARQRNLQNCCFEADNVLDLTYEAESFDVVLAARLFTVLPKQPQAIAEMHRILRPGGRCLIAEPRYAFWASLPLLAMWMLARATGMDNGCREPAKAKVLSSDAFTSLFASQPWAQMKTWQDGRYQYALCEKR
ncbi:MAG: class I SAM-dependent methyltransferase [Verrucomicrobiota bacterium]|nr:class I SAM-dependent methyltransferase [Verrucomicrobiota bacterium]